MSRRYQTILTSTFDDLKVRRLDEDSRWVFVYLLICKHANLPGLFLLPMSYITRDIQYPSERVFKAFANLTERGFMEYDAGSETVFVRTWLRHKPLDNPNKVKGALAALDEIPDSPLFVSLLKFVEENKPNGYETLIKALRNRLKTLSKEVSVSVSVSVPVEVSVPVSFVPPEKLSEEPDTSESKSDSLELFNQFWAQHPRKDKKIDALKAWKKIKNLDDVFPDIMRGLARDKLSRQWTKDNGEFIPLPATWLNARQWEDEGIQSDYADTESGKPASRHDENMDVAKKMLAKVKGGVTDGDIGNGNEITGDAVHSLAGQED